MKEPSWTSARAGAGTDSQLAQTGDRASATVARTVLGATLRQHRENAGLSATDASDAVALPPPQITDMELGLTGPRLRHVAGLCAAYGVSDQAERATLLGLARRGNSPEWWHSYVDLIPEWAARWTRKPKRYTCPWPRVPSR